MLEYKDKWEHFYYNDINPLLSQLINDAIDCRFDKDNFVQEWISRDVFDEKKNSDGYIKYIWSFGNNGNDYLYSKDKEEIKHQLHDHIVYDKKSDLTKQVELKENDVQSRRLEFQRKAKKLVKQGFTEFQALTRLESLSRLERLYKLQELHSRTDCLELHCHDYKDYIYQTGDIVYCDIPYELSKKNKTDYGGGFNHKQFYEWAKRQQYDIYYSSYTNGSIVWQKEVRSVMNSSNGAVKRNEVLFRI